MMASLSSAERVGVETLYTQLEPSTSIWAFVVRYSTIVQWRYGESPGYGPPPLGFGKGERGSPGAVKRHSHTFFHD